MSVHSRFVCCSNFAAAPHSRADVSQLITIVVIVVVIIITADQSRNMSIFFYPYCQVIDTAVSFTTRTR